MSCAFFGRPPRFVASLQHCTPPGTHRFSLSVPVSRARCPRLSLALSCSPPDHSLAPCRACTLPHRLASALAPASGSVPPCDVDGGKIDTTHSKIKSPAQPPQRGFGVRCR
ncbi:hypothetical protein B0H10DRAFT_2222543 [Mycena sp. CBHHK59/15]|nr:hypothetical protein B0H10DRAFT_2222543 [Mycena sp. CBHHK59/15]